MIKYILLLSTLCICYKTTIVKFEPIVDPCARKDTWIPPCDDLGLKQPESEGTEEGGRR